MSVMVMLPPMFWSEKTIRSRKIKEFVLEGIISDASLPSHRQSVEKLLDTQMRDGGYVPHLDLDTLYYISYNEEKEHFSFECTMFGVHVGKKWAWEVAGLSGSKFIKKG